MSFRYTYPLVKFQSYIYYTLRLFPQVIIIVYLNGNFLFLRKLLQHNKYRQKVFKALFKTHINAKLGIW